MFGAAKRYIVRVQHIHVIQILNVKTPLTRKCIWIQTKIAAVTVNARVRAIVKRKSKHFIIYPAV